MFIRLITWNNILAPYLGYVRLKLQISIQQKHFRQFFFYYYYYYYTYYYYYYYYLFIFAHLTLVIL